LGDSVHIVLDTKVRAGPPEGEPGVWRAWRAQKEEKGGPRKEKKGGGQGRGVIEGVSGGGGGWLAHCEVGSPGDDLVREGGESWGRPSRAQGGASKWGAAFGVVLGAWGQKDMRNSEGDGRARQGTKVNNRRTQQGGMGLGVLPSTQHDVQNRPSSTIKTPGIHTNRSTKKKTKKGLIGHTKSFTKTKDEKGQGPERIGSIESTKNKTKTGGMLSTFGKVGPAAKKGFQ